MRLSKILGTACAVAGLLVAAGASAGGEHYKVATAGGSLTVTPVGEWHVNKAFPWKLTCGSHVITSFELSDAAAKASGGSGACELKGAMCSKDSCEPFKAAVNF
ncbi:MAG: hypothetical protein IPF92_03710 [Myxococcales bacterium]|nr:hypothetical protein [Myxococcales bacterium]MBL0196631.1 hypothetical protein [Myxococcales bacterium]HQY62488.1 hypothetical protein [Polyangiaceae bacterium]